MVEEDNQTVCSTIDLIPNCLEYKDTNEFVICTLCKSGYFLDTVLNLCKPRTIVSNCALYNSFSDVCHECSLGYYLNSEGTICLENPTGNAFCEVYDSNGQNCISCLPRYLLINNECVFNNKIQNCLYYSSIYKCR